MEFTNLDLGPQITLIGGLSLLLLIDTLLGALSAVQGGTFKWEYLYAVGLTKGAALFRIALLLAAGAVTPFFDFSLFGLDADPFSALGLGLAVPLAASTIASIADNIGKHDLTAPQGVAPVGEPPAADAS